MTFEYDKTGVLTRQNVGDEQSITSSYNEIGKLIEVSSEAGTIRYQYDEQGFLISVENVNGDVGSYTYDTYGNKTSMTYPDGRTVSYVYDAMNRMVGVVGLDGETTSYVYDAAGRRIQTVSGGLTTRYAYDSVGNLTEQATSGASDIAFRYSYNRNGYITGEKRTENGTTTENSYLGIQAGLTSVQAYNAAGSAIRMEGATNATPGYESVPSDFLPFDYSGTKYYIDIPNPVTADSIVFSDKFLQPAYKRQLRKRGWTNEKIADVINYPVKTEASKNKYTGNSVTLYFVDDIHYVAVDDGTRKVIQIADFSRSNWRFDNYKAN